MTPNPDRERHQSSIAASRREQARLRAMSQLSHFATGASGGGETFCDRCGKPLNRWDEKCNYIPSAAHLLAEDVLYLLGETT